MFDSATDEYKNGFRHDHKTFGAMIFRLVSVNQFRPAEGMLERMKQEDCEVTEDIFLTICRGYGRVHRPLDAIRVFHKMEKFQLRPTQKSYLTIFDILVEENYVKRAIGFYKEMREKGIPPSVVSLNILIKALCKNKETVESAFRIFHEMPNRGCQPDSYTYESSYQEAANFIDEMVLGGMAPNRASWSFHVRMHNMVVQGLCNNIDPPRAFQLYLSMRTRGISVEIDTFDCLVKCFCKRGDLNKASRILDEMILDGCIPDEGIWNVLMCGLWDRKKVREATELLLAELKQNFFEAD
ncbi:hypothetical protein TSUD_318130 [Trifolium subterraneum]|uniref:Pentacotripeptide-repeat region of PRORP domain-containing protein n=1 Tax=Trifolium subterraneum TaxID=3900 RepID=A0A2Z6N2G0_TRISU|nr:hypothetical protein TSUD_318130 [Trifolium subterraneum]